MMYFQLPVIHWLRRREQPENLEELFEFSDSGADLSEESPDTETSLYGKKNDIPLPSDHAGERSKPASGEAAAHRRSAEILLRGQEMPVPSASAQKIADHTPDGNVRSSDKNFSSDLGVIAGCSVKQLRFLRRTYGLLRNANSEKYYN